MCCLPLNYGVILLFLRCYYQIDLLWTLVLGAKSAPFWMSNSVTTRSNLLIGQIDSFVLSKEDVKRDISSRIYQ